MAIGSIDERLCTGCGVCVNSCPSDVIRLDADGRTAVIAYPRDCTLCGWCQADCPERAIHISPEKESTVITSWG